MLWLQFGRCVDVCESVLYFVDVVVVVTLCYFMVVVAVVMRMLC